MQAFSLRIPSSDSTQFINNYTNVFIHNRKQEIISGNREQSYPFFSVRKKDTVTPVSARKPAQVGNQKAPARRYRREQWINHWSNGFTSL